jgi:RHS repeat-associated protein
MFEPFSSLVRPLAAHPSKLLRLSMVAIGRFASDANLYDGNSSGPGTPLRQAEDTTSKPNAVLDQLEWLLQQAGYVEGEDYTRESLEQPTPMAELYPAFSGSAQQRNDPPIEYPFEPRQFTEYTFCTPWVTEVYWYHPNYLGSVDLVTDLSGHAHQFFMYTAWGEPMFENSTISGGFDAPFRFNGKELDKETGLGYYGARYYQNRISMWLSVDPLAHVEPGWSPYRAFFFNPINFTDPTGLLESPIYDKNWNFLGTDDEGLQGDAIIMDKDDFTQGMSHEDAMAKGHTLDNMPMDQATQFANNGNFENFLSHYNNLPNRIDYSSDFTLTKEIADKHWLGGTGEGLFVNQANIDLPGVTTASFDNKEGSSFYKNFVWGMSNTGKVYGTLKLTLQNANSGSVHLGGSKFLDEYDFSMDGRPLRDFATWWGRPGGANEGKSYFIYGYGKATVPVKK